MCEIFIFKDFQNPCTEEVLRLTEVKQFKNPWDRHGFLVCVDVNSFREMNCSVGTYFNEELNHCVPEGYEPPKCPDGYCLNDGVCLVDEKNMLRCSCKKGFSGERCAVNIDECALEGNAACSGRSPHHKIAIYSNNNLNIFVSKPKHFK